MTVQHAWEEMCDWFTKYSGEHGYILLLSVISALYLLIMNKDIRVRLIVPILFLIPVVINPILYKYVYHGIRYWRLFWLLPDAVLIAMMTIDLCRRIKSDAIRCICLSVISAVILLLGQNVFAVDGWVLEPTDNPYGVSRITREVCDTILQDNPRPKCIFVDWIYNQTRMYSGDIEQLYGRDYDGFIMEMDPKIKKEADHWMKTPEDWDYLFQYAADNGITHVCMRADQTQKDIARTHGYIVIKELEFINSEWYSVFKRIV